MKYKRKYFLSRFSEVFVFSLLLCTTSIALFTANQTCHRDSRIKDRSSVTVSKIS